MRGYNKLILLLSKIKGGIVMWEKFIDDWASTRNKSDDSNENESDEE